MSGVEDNEEEEDDEYNGEEEDDPDTAPAVHNDADVAEKEVKLFEAAQRERQELMAAEKAALDLKLKNDDNDSTQQQQHRLDYLIAQSEVFAHFLAGSVATNVTSNPNKSKKGRGGRMSEAAEDAALLKTAQSTRVTTRLTAQPSNLAKICKMHPYQLEGLNWLIKLHDNGINGILADEMGLGKTLQTISLLAYLRESRGIRGPHLVIVPKSVVGNWMKELKKWCPQIHAIRMLGTKEERKRVVKDYLTAGMNKKKMKFDVLVTSYEGVLREKGSMRKVQWNYLIIDEAHRIKNENSSLSKCVRMLQTRFRILITGT